jgi:hypothetical protein
MKLSENRFFKPTVINLTLNPGFPSVPVNSANSARANSDYRAITDSIVARSKTGNYDEVRTDTEANNWSPLSFMQWFAKESKSSKLPGADNMEVMKYEDYYNEDNDEQMHTEKTDPASNLNNKKLERGSVQNRSED